MLNIVNEDNGNAMEKKDAIFLAFIADYSWDAIKKKNKNVNAPTQPVKKISYAEKKRLEREEQQRKLDESYRRMAENIQRQFQKQRAKQM
jgi:hypothetical protein